MLFLLRCLLSTMAVLTRTRKSQPSLNPAPIPSLPHRPVDCSLVPSDWRDWHNGPAIPDWNYHGWLRERITGRPELQEIVHYHLQRCFHLPSPTARP